MADNTEVTAKAKIEEKPTEKAEPVKAKPTEKETKKEETKKEEKEEKKRKTTATAQAFDERVSVKNAKVVLDRIRGRKLAKSIKILDDVVLGKRSFGKRYYTKTSKSVLELLKSAEANAKANGLDEEKLFIVSAKANKGRTFIRPRSKNSRSGEQAKMSHIEIVIGEK